MAEYSATFTLTTPGGTITLNSGSSDEYYLDPDACDGLDQAPIRAPRDKAPRTHGGIVHSFYKDARPVTLAGVLHNRTGTVAARNTMEDSLRTALDSILQANGTLTWTPTGGGARSLTVRCEIPLKTSGYFLKRFIFGLVAANPNF